MTQFNGSELPPLPAPNWEHLARRLAHCVNCLSDKIRTAENTAAPYPWVLDVSAEVSPEEFDLYLAEHFREAGWNAKGRQSSSSLVPLVVRLLPLPPGYAQEAEEGI